MNSRPLLASGSILLGGGALALLVACGGASQGSTMKRCFILDEGDVRTTLVIEGEGANASLTVLEQRDGRDLAPPEKAPGALIPEGFKYPDGTVLTITNGKLTFPPGSLLPGVVFTEGACP